MAARYVLASITVPTPNKPRSPNFALAIEVAMAGNLELADVLTNSVIHFPVRVWLSRPLAEKSGMAGGTPTHQLMAVLPDFLTMKGILGDPKADFKKLALVARAAQAGGGLAGQPGGSSGNKAGALLNAVYGLFGGQIALRPRCKQIHPQQQPPTRHPRPVSWTCPKSRRRNDAPPDTDSQSFIV